MRLALIVLLVIGSSLDFFGQKSGPGFLGHKFKIEANHGPSFYASRILGTILPDEIETYEALKYFAGELRAEAILNRRNTLGVTVKRSHHAFEVGRISNIGSNYLNFRFTTRVTSFQLNYSTYYGIAPLNRYFLIGLGVDRINMNPEDLEINPLIYSPSEATVASFPFISLELGSNAYIIDNLYFTYAVESTLAIPGKSFRTSGNFEGYNAARFTLSRILEFKLGLGVSF